jgi:hypothetical protein
VPTSTALLCSVALSNAENIPHSRNARFQVKLRTLGQEGFLSAKQAIRINRTHQLELLPKVVKFEESGSAFNLSLHKGGRCDLKVVAGEVMRAEGLHHHRPHF